MTFAFILQNLLIFRAIRLVFENLLFSTRAFKHKRKQLFQITYSKLKSGRAGACEEYLFVECLRARIKLVKVVVD